MNSPAANVGKIVRVQWVDSARSPDWTYGEPVDLSKRTHESVGWLSHADAYQINVRPHRCIDQDGDEQHCGDMTIPRAAVLSVQVIG